MSALYLISQYMSLPVPIVGQDPGPDWANNINISLSTIDSHDHTNGRGQAITPNAININSALTFANQDLTNAHSLGLFAQSGILNTSYIGALSNINGNLYFNNSSGFAVQITNNNAIVGTPGNIAGLVAPASATFNAGLGKFIWQANAGVPASIDSGPLIIRDLFPPALVYHSVTISAPSGLTTDYALTLPTLPAASEPYFVTLDSTGAMSAPWTVDHTSLDIISNKVSLHTIPNVTILGNMGAGITAVPSAVAPSLFYQYFNPFKVRSQTITSSRVYTPSAGCTWYQVQMVGGGGGGGNGNAQGGSGGTTTFGDIAVGGGFGGQGVISNPDGGAFSTYYSFSGLPSVTAGWVIAGQYGESGFVDNYARINRAYSGGQGGSSSMGSGGLASSKTLNVTSSGGVGLGGIYGGGGGGSCITDSGNINVAGASGGGGSSTTLFFCCLNQFGPINVIIGAPGGGFGERVINYNPFDGSSTRYAASGNGGYGLVIVTEYFD